LNVSQFLLSYREVNPGLRFVLFTELQTTLMDWLDRGSLDIVVGYRYAADGVRSIEVGTEDVFLLVHRDSPMASKSEITAEEVGDDVYLGLIRELDSAPVAERFFAPLGSYPEPVLEVGDVHVIVQLVAEGRGFAMVPASAVNTVAPAISNPQVVALQLKPRLRRSLAVFSKVEDDASSAVALLYEELGRTWKPQGASRSA
jgi:DNA-binding transcriptional LysR family regulator